MKVTMFFIDKSWYFQVTLVFLAPDRAKMMYSYLIHALRFRRNLSDVMANELGSNIVVSKFNIQLQYYVHFWTNTLKKIRIFFTFLSSYGLNGTTTVL